MMILVKSDFGHSFKKIYKEIENGYLFGYPDIPPKAISPKGRFAEKLACTMNNSAHNFNSVKWLSVKRTVIRMVTQ